MRDCDVAVVGAGFAGSLMAMICQRLGRSVVLVERGKHPRFAIGESSTPLTNLMIEELAARYDLPALAPLSKWGTWQESYPHVGCGLKRGFTFFYHTLGQCDAPDPNRERQLLVAASPNDCIADTHWYRPDFDQLFVEEAQRMGIEYLDETELNSFVECDEDVTLSGLRHGNSVQIRARLVIDASGPRGFLHRQLQLAELAMPEYPQTQALFSHFTGVGLWPDALEAKPPYPIDNAAVHHVFDGGWIWVLQFNNGVTSAGVAASREAAEKLQLNDGEAAWERLLAMIPKLQTQFQNAKATRPFIHVPQLSFRSGTSAGKRWVLLPSAAGFVDPLFSTGFALTLMGVTRLADTIQHSWGTDDFGTLMAGAVAKSDGEILAAARLIGSLYASMKNFPLFVALSHLYFTAVIYSETARRLGKPELAKSFLLHDHEYFGPACLELFGRVRDGGDPASLCRDIISAIEPLNLAGLGNTERHNWYPVDAKDLFENAWKVKATEEEIRAMLVRSGF